MEWHVNGAGLGLPRGSVRIHDSDPAWAEAYELLEPELQQALGELAIGIEHVGSTSVPGLAAKPILDIAIGLAPDADRAKVCGALTSIGFLDKGEGDGSIGHLFVWEDSPDHRLVHVHVLPYGGAGWRHYVVVRDRLRADPAACSAYAELKRELAVRFSDDRRAYTAAKADFIRNLLGEQSRSLG